MNDLIRVGIVGAAGYTAGELIRLLLNHPAVEIIFAHSESNAGNAITDVHAGLYGETDIRFTDQLAFDEIDVVFFCFGHGKSTQFLAEHYIPADVRIIDLAQDFRLIGDDNDYIYGLPELNLLQLQGAQHVANPGCFATCIQLGLLPLAAEGLLEGDIMVNAITGSTGAGVKPAATTHFSWRSGNMSIYKSNSFIIGVIFEFLSNVFNKVSKIVLIIGGVFYRERVGFTLHPTHTFNLYVIVF